MKLLVVLTLLASAGCQANVLRGDEPKSQLGLVKDAFWDYFAEATETAQETLKTIRESELGEQVNTKIQDSFKSISQYATIVQDQVSVIGQESYKKVAEKLDWLSEHLQPQIKEVREWLNPYLEDLEAQLEQLMERTKPLKPMLIQMTKQMERILEWCFRELENLAPSNVEVKDKIKKHWKEFENSVTPLASSLLKEMFDRAHMLKRTAAPYIHDLSKRLEP